MEWAIDVAMGGAPLYCRRSGAPSRRLMRGAREASRRLANAIASSSLLPAWRRRNPQHPEPPPMKNKNEIVSNWLPRYTGVALEDFGQHVLLTNLDVASNP